MENKNNQINLSNNKSCLEGNKNQELPISIFPIKTQ